MSRRGARPLAAKKGAENVPANFTENKEEEKQGFFSRLFGKSKKDESKQTAAKTRRVRRKSKLAEDDVFADVKALQEEIKETETHVKELEKTIPPPPPPPPPPPAPYIPPPPPPPPSTPKEAKEKKITKVVGKTNVPADDKVADVHFELMQAIKNGGRKKLRRISLRRSIGGTPIKERKFEPVTDAEVFAASVVIRDESSSDDDGKESSDELL